MPSFTISFCISIIWKHTVWKQRDLPPGDMVVFTFLGRPLQYSRLSFHFSAAQSKGGLAFYLVDNLDSQVLSLAPHNSWEKLFVGISGLSDRRKLTVGNVYRPPRDFAVDVTSFVDEFSCFLASRGNNGEVIVTGDYNVIFSHQ